MKFKTNTLISAGAVILTGAFISFLLLIKIEAIAQALLIGYFYAIVLVLSLNVVIKYVTRKLLVFSITQQWVIRSFIYLITISFAYLVGLLFQTLMLTPVDNLQQVIRDKIWQTLVELISYPFSLEFSRIFPGLQQPLIITFFAVLIFIGIISLLGSYVEIKWRDSRSKQLRDRAELIALKSQIEPHFLFNSLNTIASLISENPNKAEQLLIQLSEILHYMSFYAKKECVELEKEISFTRKYTSLLLARFDKLLEINWDEELSSNNFNVPVLLFQPVIENCVQHGWGDRQKKLHINISIKMDNNSLIATIVDDGKGIPSRILDKIPVPDHALANISDRLHLMYKQNDLINISSKTSNGTEVTITIPESCND